MRLYYRTVECRRRECAAADFVTRGRQQKVTRGHYASTDNDGLGIEEIDQIGAKHSEVPSRLFKHGSRRLVALHRGIADRLRAGDVSGDICFLSCLNNASRRDPCFDAPSRSARTLTAAGLNSGMPQFARIARSPAEELFGQDQ